ncbi:MAG TPA: efflux RND transporter periplasmic adaptor subunit [Bacteroidia bacterium]|nr:efflux RND transporter periplasmic adaptor subunit [Bacteroidia bacterium]HMU18511.1 efflux RND transporter periplasmic adaptor subunit [Bacteroidia bacterium]
MQNITASVKVRITNHKSQITLLLSAFLLLLTACHISPEAGNTEEHHGKHDNTSTVVLTAEQMKSIGIELGTLEKKQLTASLKANGILKVPNQNRASATASLGGTIKNILIQTGTSVSKGQTIATISNNTFITMQEEYLSTLAKTELANAEYDRQKTLKEGNAASQKIFQQAEAELKSLQAKKSSLQKQLELIGISTQSLTVNNIQSAVNITSPINGTISNIMVNIGSYVEANNPMAEIVDNSQLHLDLYVYEKDLQKLKEGQIIHFTLTNNPGKEYDAKIYAISNTFEENTKAVAVHATVLGNKTGLIDGMSITAIVSLENATVDAVPTNAIVNSEGQDFIFIVVNENKAELQSEEAEHKHDEHGHTHDEVEKTKPTKDETTFEKILVKKGTTDVGYSEITLLKKIPADSKIVVNGAFFILAKMTNQGEAHEH